MSETDTDTLTVTAPDEAAHGYVDFLRSEFPDWEFEVAASEHWDGSNRQLWVASQEGHHPQSELTAAKLHTRLSNYLEREQARRALAN